MLVSVCEQFVRGAMRILLVCVGSRGDVQPYLRVGLSLAKEWAHEVCVVMCGV